jgi:hypothetical protein
MRYRPLLFVAAPVAVACGLAPGESAVGRSSSADTTTAATDATITFTAGWTDSATPLVAGEEAQISYDPARLPTCRGSLGYGGDAPGWSIDADYMVNGIALNEPLGVAGAGLANEQLPPGGLPRLALPFAGTLQMWFENDDAFGCNAWDSNYGANYAFAIAPPANAPGWLGNASVLLDRGTCGMGSAAGPCYGDAVPAGTGATFGTWARVEAAITEVFFDVWRSGVTDFDNPDLWQQLDVESHTRFDPTQPFTMAYVSFAEYAGNNARYALNLRPLDPLAGENGGILTSASQCPAIPVTITSDGQYVQADMELYFTINGVALQPSGGGTFHILFQNYAGLYAVCSYPTASAS